VQAGAVLLSVLVEECCEFRVISCAWRALWSVAMGQCAISGPRVGSPEDDEEEVEQQQQQQGCDDSSPRSCAGTFSSSGASTLSSDDCSSTQDVMDAEGMDSYDQVDSAIWQRTIPKGRRCKPLSFSGIIEYDEKGNQVKIHAGDEDSWHTEECS